MTVEANGRQVTSEGNGVATSYNVPFQFISNSDLKVYLLDAADADNDTGTLLVEGDDYTISGSGYAGTASISTTETYVAGQFVRRWRDTPRDQDGDYVPNDGFPANGHELQLDRLSLVDEEQDDLLADHEARLDEAEEDIDELQDAIEDLQNPNFSVVAVTLAPGSEATALISGDYPDLVLTLGIPAGAAGGGVLLGNGTYGDIVVTNDGLTMTIADNAVGFTKFVAAPSAGFVGATGAGNYGHRTTAQAKTTLGINNVDNTSDANKPISTATQTALDGKADELPAITAASASFSADNADNNTHILISGAGTPTLTLGDIADGTAFSARFTTAWSISCAAGLSKNGASPTAVTTGSVAANSLITFLHEGGGVWLAVGDGLT